MPEREDSTESNGGSPVESQPGDHRLDGGVGIGRDLNHSKRLWICTLVLSATLSGLAWMLSIFGHSVEKHLLAIWYCAAVTLTTLLWTTGGIARRFPVFATLMNTNWRIGAIAGLALVVTATKWPQGNSFCLYLVGYYFVFLVLESVLSILHLHPRRTG